VEFHLIEISDIVAWKNNCGGECLSKQCIFDHNIYKLESLVCINSITGYFHTITVLVYANGKVYDMPRGPMSHMTYPLKGKTITKGTKGNPIGILQTLFFRHLHQKGEATAEEVKERYLKKGYVRI
jgi:hypothetical protein